MLAILGMHRSGTSSLAGSLEEAGLYLGDRDVAGAGRWNAKGNRESKTLMRLHEQILNASGGSWREPPETITWSDEHCARRDRFIRSRALQPHWGFKDPRALLLLDGWLEAIPDLAMVGTVRDPLAVAESLRRRHGDSSTDEWLQLWLTYNQRLLELQSTHGFTIIDFDLPADAYQERLRSLQADLGLRPPRGSAAFFDTKLRSAHEAPRVTVPAEIAEVHAELTRIAAEQA